MKSLFLERIVPDALLLLPELERHDLVPGRGSEVSMPVKDMPTPTNSVALWGAPEILASTVAIIAIATKL